MMHFLCSTTQHFFSFFSLGSVRGRTKREADPQQTAQSGASPLRVVTSDLCVCRQEVESKADCVYWKKGGMKERGRRGDEERRLETR